MTTYDKQLSTNFDPLSTYIYNVHEFLVYEEVHEKCWVHCSDNPSSWGTDRSRWKILTAILGWPKLMDMEMGKSMGSNVINFIISASNLDQIRLNQEMQE